MSRSLSGNSNLTLSQSTNFGFAPSLGNGLKYDSNNKIEVDLDNITGTYLGRLDPATGASTDKIQLGLTRIYCTPRRLGAWVNEA